MSIESILSKNLDRREFLEGSGKAAVGLAGLLSGCAPTLKETQQDVGQINWDCNPILPIPEDGCYTGTNAQASVMRPDLEQTLIARFKEDFGITPAFSAIGFGTLTTHNEYFPFEICRAAIDMGVIPVIRYVTLPVSYKNIIKGKFDEEIKAFAGQVAKFQHPIVLTPFQLANDPTPQYFEWAGYPPNQFKEAWVRMHDLFSTEGANKNTIWSPKLKMGTWATFEYPYPFQYIPPERYFDVIGWAANNHCKPEIGLYSQSLKSLFDGYYSRAANKFPKKPQAFWELSSAINLYQADWLDDALKDTKNRYPRIKIAMIDVVPFMMPGRYGYFDPSHTPESRQVVRKHFARGYFIGSALKK